MCTRYGEMLDMIACLAIYNGATPKKKRKHWTFDEAMKVFQSTPPARGATLPTYVLGAN